MSSTQSPTPSLPEVKKQRKQIEQDSLLLANRIKLLQIEEQRTWRKIDEMKKREKMMKEMRRQNEEAAKLKLEAVRKKELQRMENNIKITKFKEQLECEKKKKLEIIFESKRKTYAEIREIREKSVRDKYQMYVETLRQNKKRSSSVKIEHKRQALKIKKLEQSREEVSKQEYLKRVQAEEAARKEIEGKVVDLEILEMELIRKLQNTQMIQAKTLSDLEAAMKKKPMSAMG